MAQHLDLDIRQVLAHVVRHVVAVHVVLWT